MFYEEGRKDENTLDLNNFSTGGMAISAKVIERSFLSDSFSNPI
jgi:hypothetical protein